MSTRALVLCGDKWHPSDTVRHGLAGLGDKGFEFEYIDVGAKWSANMLKRFRVVLLAKANMVSAADEQEWLTVESWSIFHNFLQQGGGLVAVHAGISRYDAHPTRAMVGGAFLSHPPECDVTLEPQMPHIFARGMESFKVRDEHYFVACEALPEDIFLLSRSEHGVQPAGWTRRDGNGRVCVLTPGHGLEVWQNPSFKKLLGLALCWAADTN